MDTLYLATQTGLIIVNYTGNDWQIADHVLKGQEITSVAARNNIILAGTIRGIQRSDDNGQDWRVVNEGLTLPHIRWLAFHPTTPDLILAGTEPAGIFVSRDSAEHWTSCPEVAVMRDKFGWMLPYSPEAGCVRGFTFWDECIYAAVEVGGVLHSDNNGESWTLVKGSDGRPGLGDPPEHFVYPDVHDLAVHPSNADLVFAATGGGLYRSDNGGSTWALIYDCYCRGLWLDSADPDHIIFGPADNVGVVGRIEETHDGGRTWHLASNGLNVPWPRTMPERISQIGNELLVVLDDGRLLTAPLSTLEWEFILGDVKGVNAVATIQS